jgi:hypothetical protein
MPDRSIIVSNLLGAIGAAIGGTLGYFVFFWIMDQGFYALILPGAFLGLGCSLLASHPSTARGAVCAAAAVLLGLFTEWKWAPFRDDGSFSYALTHLYKLRPLTIIMIGVGGLVAYWMGRDGSLGGRKVKGPPVI